MFEKLLAFYTAHTPDIDRDSSILFLNQSPSCFIIPGVFLILYILMVFYLPGFLQKHNFYEQHQRTIDLVLFFWNYLLSMYSFISFMFYISYTFVKFESVSLYMCPYTNYCFSHPLLFWNYLFYASKYFELFDTLFLIVKKPHRPVRFLHYYHHITVIIIGTLGYKYEFSGYLVGSTMNTFIHSLMYMYYAVAICGRKMKGAIVLTLLQILQMFVGMFSALGWMYLQVKRGCNSKNPWLVIVPAWFVYVSYFYLFVQFFIKRYVDKKKKK